MPSGGADVTAARRVAVAPIRVYQRLLSPRPRRSAASTSPPARTTPRRRSGGSAYSAAWSSRRGAWLAATPGATAASTRSSTSESSAPAPLVMPFVFANIFQPLIDIFESVLVFIHDHVVGGSWGLAIIGLTVVVRAALLPLTLKQFRSMQALQRLAPEIKELQAKYKEDKQRLNQEMMKFYQENHVNPFSSCLPAGGAAAGVPRALLHAAQGPQGGHLPRRSPSTRSRSARTSPTSPAARCPTTPTPASSSSTT